jgi:hypothetical protein
MSKNNAIFVGWNRAVSGRESHSLEHFAEWSNYLTGLKKNGKIDSFDSVVLDPHGGDLNGFTVIRGDGDKLDAVRGTDEWKNHIVRGQRNLDNLGIVPAVVGDQVEERIKLFQKYI